MAGNAKTQRIRTLGDQTDLKYTEAKRLVETNHRNADAGRRPAVEPGNDAHGLRLVPAPIALGTDVDREHYDAELFLATDVVQATRGRGDLPVLCAEHD